MKLTCIFLACSLAIVAAHPRGPGESSRGGSHDGPRGGRRHGEGSRPSPPDFAAVAEPVTEDEVSGFRSLAQEVGNKVQAFLTKASKDALAAVAAAGENDEFTALQNFLEDIEEVGEKADVLGRDAKELIERLYVYGLGDKIVCSPPSDNAADAAKEAFRTCQEEAIMEVFGDLETIGEDLDQGAASRAKCNALKNVSKAAREEESLDSAKIRQAFASDAECLAGQLGEFLDYMRIVETGEESFKQDLLRAVVIQHHLARRIGKTAHGVARILGVDDRSGSRRRPGRHGRHGNGEASRRPPPPPEGEAPDADGGSLGELRRALRTLGSMIKRQSVPQEGGQDDGTQAGQEGGRPDGEEGGSRGRRPPPPGGMRGPPPPGGRRGRPQGDEGSSQEGPGGLSLERPDGSGMMRGSGDRPERPEDGEMEPRLVRALVNLLERQVPNSRSGSSEDGESSRSREGPGGLERPDGSGMMRGSGDRPERPEGGRPSGDGPPERPVARQLRELINLLKSD